MININNVLELAIQLIAAGMAISMFVSRINRLQREIVALRFHLESHCQMINHIQNYLTSIGYQAIDKLAIDRGESE